MHLERRFNKDGRWLTRISLPAPTSIPKGGKAARLVASVEMSDEGDVVAMYDQNGRPVEVKALLGGPRIRDNLVRDFTSTLKQFPTGERQRRARTDRDAWLDNAVVTPKAAERIARRLVKNFGKSGERNGAKRFFREGAVGGDVLVDPSHGGVIEENAFRDGVRQYHAEHSYGPGPNGALIRTKSRFEYTPGGSKIPYVIERTLSNVHLTAGGTR